MQLDDSTKCEEGGVLGGIGWVVETFSTCEDEATLRSEAKGLLTDVDNG